MTPVRLKPADPQSGVKHSTTEPLSSNQNKYKTTSGLSILIHGIMSLPYTRSYDKWDATIKHTRSIYMEKKEKYHYILSIWVSWWKNSILLHENTGTDQPLHLHIPGL